MTESDLGFIGLAVMGENLVLNLERHGASLTVYNRTAERTERFLAGRAAGLRITGATSLAGLAAALRPPRTVLLMVQAGPAVDEVIAGLRPLLSPGDLIVDGGNSHFQDTERRAAALKEADLLYLGLGVSGGEAGALWGPSLMAGGPAEAYARLAPLLTAVAAQVEGQACVAHLGPGGAGHYVKMVHNGIEYADMELIAEVYDLLGHALGLGAPELARVFAGWNQGPLASYLIEITATVLARQDEATGRPLVDLILDQAGHKGTGKWVSQNALDLGVAVPCLQAGMEARMLSALKAERVAAAAILPSPPATFAGRAEDLLADVEAALYLAKLCAYAQGLALLAAAGREYGYGFRLDEVARIWRGGCIIRARLLEEIRRAFRDRPDLPNLLVAPALGPAVAAGQPALRRVVKLAVDLGRPAPALMSALAYLDAYRSERLPANLIQAQRDYFGAHTFRRVDREGVFHAQWD